VNELINGFVESIKHTQLFCRCGELNNEANSTIKSWDEAMRHALTSKWENTKFDAQNELSESLFLKSRSTPPAITKDRLKSWNAIVTFAKKECVPLLVEAVVLPSLSTAGLATESKRGDILHVIKEDMMYIILGAAYSDVVPNGLFVEMQKVYVNGQFPCGWTGKFPEGQLVVF
jgi:hypothetical protein